MIRIILAFCLLSAPLAAQYELTGDAIGDNTWTNPENWKLPGQDPALDFPDNGATALIEVSSVQLTQPIRLGALDINTGAGRTTDLNGNTLEVTGTFTSGGADLANGTFTSPTLQLNSSLRLFSVSATTTTINAFASVTLADSSSLTFDGAATLHGDFDFGANTGTNLLENQGGTLTKTGGTGFSNVAADYTQSGAASAEVHTGNLQFDGTTMINAGTLVSASRMLFNGPTTFSSPQITLIDDGRVETLNALTLVGTLTSAHSGTGSIPGINARNGFAGGTLDCDVAAPFVMTGGSSSPTIPTTNSGAFFWDAGTLHDFTNNASTRGEFVLNNYFATPGSQTLAGHFINSGHVLQESPSGLRLDTDSLFENQSGATYENTGGNILSATGATGHQFLNSGTFLRPEQADAGSVSISVPFSSTGEVIVRDNGLRIQGPGSLSGTLRSDRSSRPDALLEFGGSGQVINMGNVLFDVLGDGLIEFESSEFRLSGLLESSEGDGLVHVRSGGADLVVQSGFPATLDFNEFVPLQIGADNNTPEIRLTDTLTNTGQINVFNARLLGTAPLKNTGTIFLERILDIGSSTEGGQLVNNGLIDFPTLNGSRIRLYPGGQLINNEPGGPDANLTGGTILLGTGDQIDSSFAASSVQVINKGAILISEGGGASIIAVFEQDGANTPSVEASRGTLSFSRDARFLAGEIRSPYLDFGSDSNPSNVRFQEDTIFGGVEIVLDNGGKVTLAGSNFDGDIFTLRAPLTARGQGLVEMSGGTLVPQAGNTNTGFNCPDETGFQLSAGTVGALGESLANVGNFDQRGGEILGTFTNGGTQILSGTGSNPSIDANFTNTGHFTWNRGNIAGNFSNGTAVTPEAGVMDVEPNASARDLEPATTFENWNLLRQKASIRSGTGVIVQQNGGILTMSGTAGFPALPGSDSHRFEMNNGILRIDDIITRNHSIQLDTFEFNGGTIHALTGDITVSSPSLSVDGGTLLCPADREIRFQASPTGTGFEAISVDGEVIFDAPGAFIALQAGGTLDGSGTLQASLVQNGEVAPGNSTGTLTIEGDLNQSASAATTIEIAPTGNDLLNVTGTATLGGLLTINLIDGASPALGDTYTILTASAVSGTFADIEVNGLAAFDVTYNATSVVLTATNPELDFDTWAADAFTPTQLADPLFSGPGADPDRDGIANLFEFIFGYSPTSDGDSFPVQFTTIPDPVDATRKIPVFEVTTVTGRTGYALDIVSLGALDTPADDAVLSSTATSAGGGVILLRADLSFPDSAGFFALRATLLDD